MCKPPIKDKGLLRPPKPEDFGQQDSKSDPLKGKNIFTWKYVAIVGVSLGFFGAVNYWVKEQILEKSKQKLEEENKGQGKADIGGQFTLIDTNRKPMGSENLKGKWWLLYFGFTHCPDICPDEMEKMAEVVDEIDKAAKNGEKSIKEIFPVFVSVDPERDSPEIIKEYCDEFHSKFIGLTGTLEKLKEVCQLFRVYFSFGDKDQDDDYIVDHTIITYLINPEGEFVDYYTNRKSPKYITKNIKLHMENHSPQVEKSWWEFWK